MFDVNRGLQGVMSNSDEAGVLFRLFLQELQDYGGDIRHLNQLLADARQKGPLMERIAKEVVGPIWKLAEENRKLFNLRFSASKKYLCKAYEKKLKILNGAREDSQNFWTESFPKIDCCYTLWHSDKPLLYTEVLEAPVEHAGFRELLAYTAGLNFEDFSGCNIIAAGSMRASREKGVDLEFPTFPSADQSFGEIKVGWRGVKRPKEDRLPTSCFYLVRVYS